VCDRSRPKKKSGTYQTDPRSRNGYKGEKGGKRDSKKEGRKNSKGKRSWGGLEVKVLTPPRHGTEKLLSTENNGTHNGHVTALTRGRQKSEGGEGTWECYRLRRRHEKRGGLAQTTRACGEIEGLNRVRRWSQGQREKQRLSGVVKETQIAPQGLKCTGFGEKGKSDQGYARFFCSW